MNWDKIADFLPLLLFFGLWLLTRLFQKPEDADDKKPPASPYANENEENRSGVEEEIRRMIAERQGTEPESPIFSPDIQEAPVPEIPSIQDRLAEERRKIQEAKRTLAATRKKSKDRLAKINSLEPLEDKKRFFAPLRQPDTLRKAFVYNELLNPPLGLRQPDGSFTQLWQK